MQEKQYVIIIIKRISTTLGGSTGHFTITLTTHTRTHTRIHTHTIGPTTILLITNK